MQSLFDGASESGEPQTLDDAQRQLLRLLGCGLSVAEAAERLHLSARTAERRLAEARATLGATTNAEAVIRARGPGVELDGTGVTPRELEVLELVAEGLRDEAIAARLRIAPSTVATLIRSSMERLDARTRVEAVAKLAGIKDEPEPTSP
jgi:DNA-binding NarL/FixJ family response regulator